MAAQRRRAAITGIGMVSPAGNDTATTWDALLAGRSAAGRIGDPTVGGRPVSGGPGCADPAG